MAEKLTNYKKSIRNIDIKRRRSVFFISISIGLAIGLLACGGGQAIKDKSGVQIEAAKLHSFLYANVNSTTEYIAVWDSIAAEDSYPQKRFDACGIDVSGYSKSLVKISYPTNNLPQYAVHIHNFLNNKLLIYNHGHGGIPSTNEQYARDFIRQALDIGFDVLITSLPLTGINEVDRQLTNHYKMKVYGHSGLVSIGDDLLARQPHLLYELLDDNDHYMHDFIDPIVVFSSITKKQIPSENLSS